jgi:peptidyl-tRNA hydrolase, PTH2 family
MKTKQVIIIRKDLKMRKGKMCSQAAHASMKAILDLMNKYYDSKYKQHLYQLTFGEDSVLNDWLNGIFTKITVGVESLEELNKIYEAAALNGWPCAIIEDVGLTEFGGVPTITAAAIGPYQNEEIDKLTNHLKLL